MRQQRQLQQLPRSCYFNRSLSTTNQQQQQQQEPRVNQLGIQYLSNELHGKLFPKSTTTDYLKLTNDKLLTISKKHLAMNDLLGKKTQITDPITINNFPSLVGTSLDEHFYKIGKASMDPYMPLVDEFFRNKKTASIPKIPSMKNWKFEAGWTRYDKNGGIEKVDYPLEDALVFDVETLYKISDYPVLATCASSKAWYGWVSPALIQYQEQGQVADDIDWNQLIPMNGFEKEKIIVGYNVSYDRARILEEYSVKQSKVFFIDAMALHISTNGFCSRQRAKWNSYQSLLRKGKANEDELVEEEDDGDEMSSDKNSAELAREDSPWMQNTTGNSLREVAEFYCNIKMNKSDRDFFSSEDPSDVTDNFAKLMDYCARDVDATYKVTKRLLPIFFQKIPHPVSFAALRHLGTLFLPTTTNWEEYLETAEKKYQENRLEVSRTLIERAEELVEFVKKNDESLKFDYESDPWLSQLNWTLKLARVKKDGTPYKKTPYLSGYPEWYRELFKASKGEEINLTLKTRITPLLLRLKWEGYPIFWTNQYGWCFKVPYDEEIIEQLVTKKYHQIRLFAKKNQANEDVLNSNGKTYTLFKIPHPDGPNKRCTGVLSKMYLRYFEDGTLTSKYDYAGKILQLNGEASYWLGNRTRITDQFVVYNDPSKNQFFPTAQETKSAQHSQMGIILPRLVTMGTVTRRASENTWLTASNAKSNRIGSELKSLIRAPTGYCFIGADVDSEELWIASLVGDAKFGIHGGTALGWMTLEGEKSQKTDLHSKTASILGISRNHAKVFNYGRIYGAGVKFACSLLKNFNPNISDEEATQVSRNLYDNTKGRTATSKHLNPGKMYYGGTESIMFNTLEAIAQQEAPKTPVLGASMTDSLNVKHLNTDTFMTSRVNWTIQSSGVDYLHLLVISMEYLSKKYNLDSRLVITVHDELRYMVKEEDKYKACLLLQISNLWTRAMFCEQMGIKEVPQSCGFFSEVDIDHVLRKEVSMDCVTPSSPNPIPPGESLDILGVLEKCQHGDILKTNPDFDESVYDQIVYENRETVLSGIDRDLSLDSKIAKIQLETSKDRQEWRKNMYEFVKVTCQSRRKQQSPIKKKKVIKREVPKTTRNVIEFDLEDTKIPPPSSSSTTITRGYQRSASPVRVSRMDLSTTTTIKKGRVLRSSSSLKKKVTGDNNQQKRQYSTMSKFNPLSSSRPRNSIEESELRIEIGKLDKELMVSNNFNNRRRGRRR
ncbi:MIP1 DNA polymerase gamma [Candida maltosa Xu316]